MKLVRGVGNPAEGGCWMVAAGYYATNGARWDDHPECVDPLIAGLCIDLNDALMDGERERVIGPHLFTPVGTNDPGLATARWNRVERYVLDAAADVLDDYKVLHDLRGDWTGRFKEAVRTIRPDFRKGVPVPGASAICDLETCATYPTMLSQIALLRSVKLVYSRNLPRERWIERVLDLILELCAMSTPVEPDPARRAATLRAVCRVE